MDRSAAQSLLDELLPRLRRLAAALYGRGPLADALVLRTWERALLHLKDFDGRSRFDLWVAGQMIQLYDAEGGETAWDERQRSAVQPGFEVPRVSTESLRAEMTRLGPAERAAVALVCVEGLSYGEAARCLGLQMKELVARLIAARRALINGLGGISAVLGEGSP